MRPATIAIVSFNDISPFHLSVPCAVFGEDRLHPDVPKFKLLICAGEKGGLRTSAGFSFEAPHRLSELKKADIVIVPSWRDTEEMPPPPLLQALRQAHEAGALVVGLCLGTFVLAAAGLLDGRPAATHWGWADKLAERYPEIDVKPDVLYVDDGDILTSAGVAAGIDCCLHIMRKRYGSEVANRVARRMVVPPHRQGGQAQYVEQPVHVNAHGDRLMQVMEQARRHLDKPHSLDSLAEQALMSRRTFTRRFKQATGTTVGKWLLNQRIAYAQRLLETTGKPIELIAQLAGFGSALSLRQHFQTQLKTSPGRYRKEFSAH
jgi:transcriptional regulator GlxA family with amidase domain